MCILVQDYIYNYVAVFDKMPTSVQTTEGIKVFTLARQLVALKEHNKRNQH